MENLLHPSNLIELHQNLEEFAYHHQNKGGQRAHQLVKQIWDESKKGPRDGSTEGRLADAGYDQAMRVVLDALHNKFVP